MSNHWFENKRETKKPVAVHWKGHALELLPVILSAIWVASICMRFAPGVSVSSAVPFLVFSGLAAAQGVKYYFYHEKTK